MSNDIDTSFVDNTWQTPDASKDSNYVSDFRKQSLEGIKKLQEDYNKLRAQWFASFTSWQETERTGAEKIAANLKAYTESKIS